MKGRILGLALLASASGCAPRATSPEAPAPAATQTGAAAPAPAPSAAPRDLGVDKLLASEPEYQGWRYFQVYCARCHGDDALGNADAPNLTYSVTPDGGVSRDSFFVMVHNGSTDKKMKGFQELLDDPQIANVYAYVKARSEGRLGRGRPHRAPTPP